MITILIPSHNNGLVLEYAVRSVLRQTVTDWELFIVGDGIVDAGRQVAQSFVHQDSRIRFFDFPKGARHGEENRRQALQSARGDWICYLSDDDILLPHHLETLMRHASGADFINAMALSFISPEKVEVLGADLQDPDARAWHLSGRRSVIALSCGAHSRDYYQRMAGGWSPAPTHIATDLHMWRRFLADPACRVKSLLTPTVLHFPAFSRKGRSSQQRLTECAYWWDKSLDPEFISEMEQMWRIILLNGQLKARDLEKNIFNFGAFAAKLKDFASRLRTKGPAALLDLWIVDLLRNPSRK